MTESTLPVWAVAANTLCEGWSPGTTTEQGIDYADVYLIRTEAEQELADLIRERLTLFIEDHTNYGDIGTALDCGYEVIEAEVREDGTVLVDGEEKGICSPTIRQVIDKTSNRKDKPC